MNPSLGNRSSILHPIALTVALVGLLVFAFCLVLYAPAQNPCEGSFYGHIGHPPTAWIQNLAQTNSDHAWTESLKINFDTGKCERPFAGPSTTAFLGVDKTGHQMECLVLAARPESAAVTQTYRWELRDADSWRLLRSHEFSAPVPSSFHFTRDHASIRLFGGYLIFIDFDGEHPGRTIKFPFERGDQFGVVDGTRTFYRATIIQPPAKRVKLSIGPTIFKHELFVINDHNDLVRTATWYSGPLPDYNFQIDGREIVTLTPDAKHIEVHSASSGELISSQPVPEGFDPLVDKFSINDRLILVDSRSTIYDTSRQEWFYKPDEEINIALTRRNVAERLEDGLVLWRSGERNFTVIDQNSKSVLCDFETASGSNWVAQFIDSSRLAIASRTFGGCVNVYDVRTGDLLKSHRPFLWIAWCLPIVLIGYAAWSVCFIVHRARGNGWAWLDVAILLGIPLTILTLRLLLRGSPGDIARLPYSYAQGSSAAGIALTTVWLVWGRTSWTLRVLPVGITIAFVLLMIVLCLGRQPELVWQGIASVTVPCFAAITALAVSRWAGLQLWRIEPVIIDDIGNESDLIAKQHQWSIRNLFLITAVTALMLAVARPVFPEVGELLRIGYLQWHLLTTVILLVMIPPLALTSHGRIHAAAMMCIAATYLTLVAEATIGFIDDSLLEPWLPMDVVTRVQMAFVVAMYTGLMPYRRRRWRIGQRSGRIGGSQIITRLLLLLTTRSRNRQNGFSSSVSY